MKTLLHLIGSALSGNALPEGALHELSRLSPAGWEELYRMAEEQSVTGLFYHALSSLPVDIPESVSFQLVSRSVQIENSCTDMAAASGELIGMFADAGLHPIEMKGATIAAMYPAPGLREYGDIDLYFPGEESARAAEMLRARGAEVSSAPDGSFHFRYKGIDIDSHNRYYDLYGNAPKPEPGSPEAVLLMLSAHTLKHAAGAGAGLRQICDLAAAFRHSDGQYDPGKLREYCVRNGIEAWNKLVCSFIATYLGIPDSQHPFNKVSPAPLLKIVAEGGNFGHHSASRSRALEASPVRRKADTAMRFLKHLPFALRYAPRVALSSVFTLVKGNLS